MKKLSVITSAFVLLFVPLFVTAHQGELDYRGGHEQNGVYHFHVEWMNESQKKNYEKFSQNLCNRVLKRIQKYPSQGERLAQRIEKRYSIRCEIAYKSSTSSSSQPKAYHFIDRKYIRDDANKLNTDDNDDQKHLRGDENAVITITVYTDYQCPFCGRFHKTIQEVLQKYPQTVNIVYRHYPLSFHQNAFAAANAAECAAGLGGNSAFWKYSELLFEKGTEPDNYAEYATEIGLSGYEFRKCIEENKYEDLINKHIGYSKDAGVTGTPSSFACHNLSDRCEKISGAQPFSNLQQILDDLIKNPHQKSSSSGGSVSSPFGPPSLPEENQVKKIRHPISGNDHINGDKNSKVSVITYTDFECPFCKRHRGTLNDLADKYSKNEVNFIYRHFPLSFHKNARQAALAAECAWDQAGNSAFWSYSMLLFENGTDDESIKNHARKLDLDMLAFNSCLTTEKFAAKIQEHINNGKEDGVAGTPINFICENATLECARVSGAQPIEAFTKVIDGYLK